jgi:hypothetical protein
MTTPVFFYVSQSRSKMLSDPTSERLQVQGGILEDGQYKFYSGKTATSPSGACKACLERPNTGTTHDKCQWQGPMHVYIKFPEKPWTRLNELEVDISGNSVFKVRKSKFYERNLTMA